MRDLAVVRRALQDVPAALCAQHRQCRAQHVEHPEDVRVEDGARLLAAEIARRTRSTPERGREFAEQVLAELAAEAPDLTAWLRPHLPDELAALLRPAPVPDAAIAGHPRRILPDELDRRLRELEDWSGDCHRISRTILLTQEWIEPLRRRVDRAEQEAEHHVRTEWIDGGVRFVAWTRSIDAVTELDLALAARIDEAVRAL